MITLQIILAIVIALTGYPGGLFIAKSTKEELKAGRKWFKLIMTTSLVLIILSLILIHNQALLFLLAIFVFIFLLALAALIKAKKK